MTTLRQALEQARDALKAHCGGRCNAEYNPCADLEIADKITATLTAGREALQTQGEMVPQAWTNLLAYVLQDDLHNRLTPRVVDIAYTAFNLAKQPNTEDGGASDWFNDTKPKVAELIAKLRKDLIEEMPATHPQASEPAPSTAWDARWAEYPEKCPITRRDFFMVIEHPKLGMVPTYGGPYDSYTIPVMEGEPDQPFQERELRCERYDHDFGGWVEDEGIPLRVISESALEELQAAALLSAPALPVGELTDKIIRLPIPASASDLKADIVELIQSHKYNGLRSIEVLGVFQFIGAEIISGSNS